MANASDLEMTQEMIAILRDSMARSNKAGKTKRGAHAKCHGLLKADFFVYENIPSEMKVGIFSAPNVYPALIRLSNASAGVQSDKKTDFRGCAIKLLGVEGDRFNLDEKQSQDFVLMSNPTMPLGTVKLFRDAIYYAIKWHPLLLALRFVLTGHGSVLTALKAGKKFDTSMLDINYWSTTPYAFGKKAVKYKVSPTSSFRSKLPSPLTDGYLTGNTSNHLLSHPASFDFSVQFFDSEKTTPIEDAAIAWTEKTSPFVKLATINIPIQRIDLASRFELAEVLSFSPAHSLEVHCPLGGLNLARSELYKSLSQFRHERSGSLAIEPTRESFDSIE